MKMIIFFENKKNYPPAVSYNTADVVRNFERDQTIVFLSVTMVVFFGSLDPHVGSTIRRWQLCLLKTCVCEWVGMFSAVVWRDCCDRKTNCYTLVYLPMWERVCFLVFARLSLRCYLLFWFHKLACSRINSATTSSGLKDFGFVFFFTRKYALILRACVSGYAQSVMVLRSYRRRQILRACFFYPIFFPWTP